MNDDTVVLPYTLSVTGRTVFDLFKDIKLAITEQDFLNYAQSYFR